MPERLSKGLLQWWAERAADDILDVAIVGSGYGGSMAAYELSGCEAPNEDAPPSAKQPKGAKATRRRPLKVVLFERGNEFQPDDFPAGFGDIPRELRLSRQKHGSVIGAQGLYDLRLGDDVQVLQGNGLGGGSLINAGVLLEPDAPTDGASGAWPQTLRELASQGHFRAVRRLLGAEQRDDRGWFPNHIGRLPFDLPKTRVLDMLSPAAPADRPPITVALAQRSNVAGRDMQACTLCGDCLSGCRGGAKESLDRNLLELAARRGVALCTGASVVSLARVKPQAEGVWLWKLRLAHTDPRLQQRQGKALTLLARKVVLAAGTLGSSEILLRSRNQRLAFSARLGQGFSCNGDNIAAISGLPQITRGCAHEDVKPCQRGVGPTITASLTLPTATPANATRPVRVQEFAVPGALHRVFAEMVTTVRTVQTLGDGDRSAHSPEQPDPHAVDPQAMRHTLLVGLIGHDDARGSLRLADPVSPRFGPPTCGTLRIDWPEARTGRELLAAQTALRERVAALPSTPGLDAPRLLPNPMWNLLPAGMEKLVTQPYGPVLTVHPLGGCGVGDDVGNGVVSGHGAVFDAAHPQQQNLKDPALNVIDDDCWFGSLLVVDGAAIPGSLGANPALTIAAFARRALRHWRDGDWGFVQRDTGSLPDLQLKEAADIERRAPVDYPPPTLAEPPEDATEVEMVERLFGEVDLQLGGERLPAMVELTLAYHPANAARLAQRERAAAALHVDPARSRLRIYRACAWHKNSLHGERDEIRDEYVLIETAVSGRLDWLHREATQGWRRTLHGGLAWLRNRGGRDLWQELIPDDETLGSTHAADAQRLRSEQEGQPGMLRSYLNLSSRAGEVRRFDYALQLAAPRIHKHQGWPVAPAALRGHKRLTYNRRANPWQQLMRLSLTEMPGLGPAANPAPQLELDPCFLVDRGLPLLRLARQRDHADGLLALAALAAYLARVILSVHLWSFRKPDAQPARKIDRLPGVIAGLPTPEIDELPVDRWPEGSPQAGKPLTIRLTRYPKPGAPPLLLVHGYSVSGNTFTHPSLPHPAAKYFWRAGRDVWVVDLRTSAGLDSARHPWSMETVALIDLPAALLHVFNSTGQRVDVFAHCIGCVMLSMALLTRAADVHSGTVELGVDTRVKAEQLGNLAALNGPAPHGGPHPVVRRVVLSQKGPVLRYTDNNIFRGFVLRFARRWLLGDDYQFQPSADPGVAEQLTDRLLASLPYPPADYDVENPLWPCAKTPWVSTRHRMDALYGRDFDAANLTPETLAAIDDLFGPINLDTVAQTLHFQTFDAITNQAGRGEFVTLGRMHHHWGGIPTAAFHGVDNGLVDVHTQRLLDHLFGDQLRLPFRGEKFEGFGHQDVLIGRRADEVYRWVQDFLQADELLLAAERDKRASNALPLQTMGVIQPPWIGPRLIGPEQNCRRGQIAVMPRPDQGNARLLLLVAWRERNGRISLSQRPDDLTIGDPGPSGRWLFAPRQATAPLTDTDTDTTPGWITLLHYAVGEHTGHHLSLPPSWQPDPAVIVRGQIATRTPDVGPPHPGLQHEEVLQMIHDWAAGDGRPWLAQCYVRRAAEQDAQNGNRSGLLFALSSCQYPAGLLDERCATRSLSWMASLARAGHIGLSLMVGDQIYADCSAGLVDPNRRDERLDQPHERALRLAPMRALMREVPVASLPDDHEISDNWEPLPEPPGQRCDAKAARALREQRKLAVASYRRWWRMDDPKTARRDPRASLDLEFEWNGLPFYLLDTRTRRRRPQPDDNPEAGHLIPPSRLARLLDWLTEQGDRVKFVATPSLLLPRRRRSARASQEAAASDAWDGFPATLRQVLSHIHQHGLRNTVFLSGDEHHSLYTEIWLGDAHDDDGSDDDKRQRIKVVSVHCSGSYTPFPFANGRPQELIPAENFALGTLPVEVKTTLLCTEQGFGLIGVTFRDDASPLLRLRFVRPEGKDLQTVIPLG